MENHAINFDTYTDYMLLARAINYTQDKPAMVQVGLLLSTVAVILNTRIKHSTDVQLLLRTIRDTSDLMLDDENRMGHRPHYTTADMVNIVDLFRELLGKIGVETITFNDSELSGMAVPHELRIACMLLTKTAPGVFKVV